MVNFIIQLSFEHLFFKDKVPFKISQKDFEQRYESDVLVHKRLLQYFHLAFIVIYGILAFIDLFYSDSPLWIVILAVSVPIALSIWIITNILALNSQIKMARSKQ